MTEISFYHLTLTPLEKALPKILEKIYQSKRRAVVLCPSPEIAESLAELLWTFTPTAFLPHGTQKDGFKEDQPIWLTHEDEPPQEETLLVLIGNRDSTHLANYQRCLDFFDGTNSEALEKARLRWKAAKNAGHSLTYWQQNTEGGWKKKE